MLFALPLIYVAVAYLVAGYVLVNEDLTERLCDACNTDREVLIAIVAGVMWPILAVCYVLGLVAGVLDLLPNGGDTMGACEHP